MILKNLKKLGNYEMRLSEDKIQEIMSNLIEIELKPGVELRHIANELRFIGIINQKRTRLSQTAYILKKRGKYFICHFKQLMELDGKNVDYTAEDKARTHWIAQTLSDKFGKENSLYSIVSGYDETINFDDFDLNITSVITRDYKGKDTISWYESDKGLTLQPMYHFD